VPAVRLPDTFDRRLWQRDRLADSGFVVYDHGQEAAIVRDGNTPHSRRTISALPDTGPVREPPRRGWW